MTAPADYDRLAGRMLQDFLRRTHLSTPAALPQIVADTVRGLGGTDGTIYLIDHEQETLVPMEPVGVHRHDRVSVEGTLHGRSFAAGSIVQAESPDGAGRRLIVPLLDGTERLGTLEVTMNVGVADVSGEVRREVVEIAERFAHLVAETIVTKAAYGDSIELVRRSRPMHVSAELVRAVLPPLVFATDDLVIAGLLEPCYEVGGDIFDYAVNDRTLHFAIFDAMGHGLAAARDAAFAVAAYRSARRRGEALLDIYVELDQAMQDTGERYLTGVIATLDLDTGRLEWLSAGHPAPLLVREGRFVKTLDAQPLTPIGVPFVSGPPTLAEESLQPGDLVMLYTDGLPEARMPDGDFFTVERLAEFVERQAAAGFAAPETLRRLRHAVLAHQHGELQDDATAVLVEWRSGREQRLVPDNV